MSTELTLRLNRLGEFEADSHGQSRVLSEFVRTKTYLKDLSSLLDKHPRDWRAARAHREIGRVEHE
jgi:hypothetical protein